MFEKEAEEYTENPKSAWKQGMTCVGSVRQAFKDGAEFGYNKAKEDARLKLKDKGIIQPLKSSILRNERLSSQEQQELCAWIECAMDFGEKLDECAKELEEANKANEWHYVKSGDLPPEDTRVLALMAGGEVCIAHFYRRNVWDKIGTVIAWKEIVLPKEIEK